MNFRISPLWWPALLLASPLLMGMLLVKNQKFRANRKAAAQRNRDRISSAPALALPAHKTLKLTALVEYRARPGFSGAPGVSYLLDTGGQSLLFDMGFGDEDPVLSGNLAQAALDLSGVKGLVISHLHPDHMGGFAAAKTQNVPLPKGLESLQGRPCFVPDAAGSQRFDICRVTGPKLLPGGIGTTGPLDRSLFFMGLTAEQTLLVRLREKGIVVITGCGHPTLPLILDYVQALMTDPVYAVVGGLHLPVTDSPLKKPGLKVQMVFATGKPPWQRISDREVDETVAALNRCGVKHLFLSTHDICPYAAGRLEREFRGTMIRLEAGATYTL